MIDADDLKKTVSDLADNDLWPTLATLVGYRSINSDNADPDVKNAATPLSRS